MGLERGIRDCPGTVHTVVCWRLDGLSEYGWVSWTSGHPLRLYRVPYPPRPVCLWRGLFKMAGLPGHLDSRYCSPLVRIRRIVVVKRKRLGWSEVWREKMGGRQKSSSGGTLGPKSSSTSHRKVVGWATGGNWRTMNAIPSGSGSVCRRAACSN